MGDHPDRLVGLVERGAESVVITNACDSYAPDDRRAGVEREMTALRDLGFRPRAVDLRAYFGRRQELRQEFRHAGLVWVRGGSVFMLRHALAASGADDLIVELLKSDAIAYGGYSAGVCVLSPTLRGLELGEDPDVVMRTYGVAARYDGLSVIPYAIVPHVGSSDHPQTRAADQLTAFYDANGISQRRLRDGQVIVVRDAVTEIV